MPAVLAQVNITDPFFLEGLLLAARISSLEQVLLEHARTGTDPIDIIRRRLNALNEAERRNNQEEEAGGPATHDVTPNLANRADEQLPAASTDVGNTPVEAIPPRRRGRPRKAA